ncbi:hypothetical protein PORCRE_1114 [Porphyromonas crevioricanis JCM 15906]|uniref:Uncharacterized protein n=1 Tax=Porphyromonas crevioricanis JCM 15906 TaxID=1305617 RepID=T1CQR2_9PORP|nr:hypothetical protein PORCRE_1114 [Porphyromonas crevioricanis JCM 15906]GAD07637.1 hypothetical protein PORCAN_1260 [Porphyromonas crevioricanis JCM 13913]
MTNIDNERQKKYAFGHATRPEGQLTTQQVLLCAMISF